MYIPKLSKLLLTFFLSFHLSLVSVKAQEQKIKETTLDKKKYSILEDKVKERDWAMIIDEETLSKVLKTKETLEGIEDLLQRYDLKTLKLLGLYARGQELTINYTEYLEWGLTSSVAKLLKYILIGEIDPKDFIKEFKDLKRISDCAEQIANNPEIHMKFLAYQYFSTAREKWEANYTIIKKIKEGETLDYLTAKTFEENGEYINIYIKASQQLYYDTLNTKPLEKRWTIEFIKEIKNQLPENLESLTEIILKRIIEKANEKLEELEPYKKFVESIRKNKDLLIKQRKERDRSLDQKIKELINKVDFDKNKIVFVSKDENKEDEKFEIYSMSEDGNNVIKLTNNNVDDLQPQWVYGNKIIYSSKQNGNWDIWIMDRNGSNKKSLTINNSNESNGRISPDGNWLFYISNKNGNYDIYKENLFNEKIKQLTNTKEREENLEISPDGNWVAYEKWRDSDLLGIYITSIDGSTTKDLGWGHDPTWTPKGDISFSERGKVIIKNIAGNEKFVLGKELENIKEKPLIVYPCCWIDESKLLYRLDSYIEKERGSYMNLYVYDRITKEIKPLTKSKINIWNDHADYLSK